MVVHWWHSIIPHNGSIMYKIQQKLKIIKTRLKHWNQHTFGNIFQSQQDLAAKMDALQQRLISSGCTEELDNQEKQLKNQIEEREIQEEMLWKQKSRIRWLKEGEKNTKLFHRSTIQRRMVNHISILRNEQGVIWRCMKRLNRNF